MEPKLNLLTSNSSVHRKARTVLTLALTLYQRYMVSLLLENLKVQLQWNRRDLQTVQWIPIRDPQSFLLYFWLRFEYLIKFFVALRSCSIPRCLISDFLKR